MPQKEFCGPEQRVNSDEKLPIGQSQRAVMKSTWKQKRHWKEGTTQSQVGRDVFFFFFSNTDQMGPALFYSRSCH